MASNEADVSALNKNLPSFLLISGPGTELVRVVFNALYRHDRMDSKKGTLTLRECFDERLKNTPELIISHHDCVEKYFEHPDAKIFDKNILEEKLDVTFYCKGIRHFCFEGRDHPLSELTLKSLEELRKKRNDVMHLSATVDEDKVQELFYELLNQVEQDLGGVFIAEARPRIYLFIQQIMNEEIDYKEYLRERENYWKILKKEFMEGSLKELRNFTFEMPASPFTTFLKKICAVAGSDDLIEKSFTPPVLLIEEKKKMKFRDILAAHEEGKPATVVVSGEGGCGKSTLCHVAFEQWRRKAFQEHKIEDLDSVDLIIYIKLKFARQSSLYEFLRDEYLVVQMKDVKKESLVPLLRDSEVLCLIDGYDEKNENANDLICDVVSCLPKSRIIITSRPEFQDDCTKALIPRSPVTWNLDGFGHTEFSEFVMKLISILRKDDANLCLVHRFVSYVESRASTFARSLKLPVELALTLALWLQNLDTPHLMDDIVTATQLQHNLMEMLRKALRKKFSDLDRDIRLLQAVAFNQLNDDQNVITKPNEVAISKNCASPENILEGFLVCETKHSMNAPATHSYSFLSRPQMEFFGAHHVSHDLKHALGEGKPLDSYFTHSKPRKYKGMFPYLAGCLAQTGQLSKHSNALLNLCKKARIQSNDFNFWCSLLQETTKREATSLQMLPNEALKKEIISYLKTSWTLQPDAVISGLKLLTHYPEVQNLTVNLDWSDTSHKELQEILQQLHDARSKVRSAQKMNLLLHVEHGGCDGSYIKYFADWCTLVEFTGCVREDEVKQLLQCKTVNATVQDVPTFNALAKKASLMGKLEKLTMSVSFPENHVDEVGVRPQSITVKGKNVTTDLIFTNLIDADISKTIQFVRAVYPRPKGLDHVRFQGNLSFADGVQIAKGLQGCVVGKVYIRSLQFLTEDQEKELISTNDDGQRKSSFMIVWNDKEIYSQYNDD